MLLYQLERSGGWFVVTKLGDNLFLGGERRFCIGLQFFSKADADAYVDEMKNLSAFQNDALKAAGDSLAKKMEAREQTMKRAGDVERKYARKCRKVTFDIDAKEAKTVGEILPANKVRNVQPLSDIWADAGKQPARMA